MFLRLNEDVLIVDVFDDEVVVVLIIDAVDDGFDRWIAFNKHAYSALPSVM